MMKSKKGVALALNTVVLLILAAVVLSALFAFFFDIFNPGVGEARRLQQQTSICQEIFARDPTCSSTEVLGIASSKLIDGNNDAKVVVCKKGIACSTAGDKSDEENCIANCCSAFCPR